MRGKSNFRGVSWCEKVRKWRALLWDGSKQRFLGHFALDSEAARAYDRALLELKGADAKTNFPAAEYADGGGGGGWGGPGGAAGGAGDGGSIVAALMKQE
ncbi:hypothetical protein FOA52_001451 [Chlamydomonas sp. UWO 241]|nr:hypothetical protein FOA52_001451 [Chlamydomonas sp. UWO 241]